MCRPGTNGCSVSTTLPRRAGEGDHAQHGGGGVGENIVIASEAKQSSLMTQHTGLLRRCAPRNDGTAAPPPPPFGRSPSPVTLRFTGEDGDSAHSQARGTRARLLATAIAGIALGTMLGGCSDIYYDRSETIALGAGDAIAANETTQMVDPWPRYSGNKNIAFNGERMQRAVECYRNNKVTPPIDIDPTNSTGSSQSTSTNSSQTSTAGTACQGKMSSGSAQPASAAAGSAALVIALPGSTTAAK